jgi:hypothetical protein
MYMWHIFTKLFNNFYEEAPSAWHKLSNLSLVTWRVVGISLVKGYGAYGGHRKGCQKYIITRSSGPQNAC